MFTSFIFAISEKGEGGGFSRDFVIQPERIPLLREDEAKLYAWALRLGISQDYIAWPQNPGNPHDPVTKKIL